MRETLGGTLLLCFFSSAASPLSHFVKLKWSQSFHCRSFKHWISWALSCYNLSFLLLNVTNIDIYVAVDGPVTVTSIDLAHWPLSKEGVSLAEWLVCETCNLEVWGLKPALDLCALPHTRTHTSIHTKMSVLVLGQWLFLPLHSTCSYSAVTS